MCLQGRIQSRGIFRISQAALLLFFLLQLPARHHPAFHPGLIDGARGFLLAVAIGAMILSTRKSGGGAGLHS